MVRMSSSEIANVRPPELWNSSTSCAVFGPVGHGELRKKNSWRQSESSPVALQAFLMRLCAATALVAEMARKAQCRSSSVVGSRLCRSRACSATSRPGGGSQV